jgi:hypothetical protein
LAPSKDIENRAATRKCPRYFEYVRGSMIPMRERKIIRIGSWKTSPIERHIVERKSKYWPGPSIGRILSSETVVARKYRPTGTTR